MPSIEELLNGEDTQEDVFAPVSGYRTYEYTDSNIIYVDNKHIGDMEEQIAVQGESDSQYIIFERDRFFDGIDLTAKTLQIHYEREDGQGDNNAPVNVQASSTRIRAGWVVPAHAMEIKGKLKVMPFATGTAPTGNQYVLKDLYSEWSVNPALSISGGIAEPENDWYMQFLDRMEDYVTDAQTYANNAEKSQTAAKTSEANAANSAATAQAAKDQVAAQQAASVAAVQAAGQAQIDGMQAYLDNYISYDKVDGLAIKGIAEGTDIRVEDSADYHVMDLDIYGKSEQTTTHGDQLAANFDTLWADGLVSSSGVIDRWRIAGNGSGSGQYTLKQYENNTLVVITSDANIEAYISQDNVSVEVGETYVLSCYARGSGEFRFQYGIENYASHSETLTGTFQKYKYVFTVEQDKNKNGKINIYAGLKNPGTVELYGIMFEKGDAPHEFEPYTGGQPSPNVDYPQKIVSVGDNGALALETTGKNLLNFEDFKANGTNTEVQILPEVNGVRVKSKTAGTYRNADNIFKVKKNTTYRLSGHIRSFLGSLYNVGFSGSSDGGETWTSTLIAGNGVSELSDKDINITLQTGEYNTVRLVLYCTYSDSDDGDVIFGDLQLEEGSVVTEYQPYEHSAIVVPLSGPLHGIPTASGDNVTIGGQQYVADRLEKRNGRYGIMRYCDRAEFDGSADEKWAKWATNTSNVYRFATTSLVNTIKLKNSNTVVNNILCSCFSAKSNEETRTKVEGTSIYNSGTSVIGALAIYSDRYNTDITAWTDYLAEHPMTVVYELATPVWEEFDDATQALLRSLETYYPVTRLTVSGDPLCRMVYARDPEIAYDALETRVSALE